MSDVKVSTAILSHLSDVQTHLELALNSQNLITQHVASEEARQRINFVKMLILKYPDTSVSVSNDKLDEIQREVFERFPKKAVS